MKCRAAVVIFILFVPLSVWSDEENPWEVAIQANLYIFADETFLNPIVFVNKSKLHLEARYNYEDHKTGSLFAGYTFRTGDEFQFEATPLIGGVFGRSAGVAPGFIVKLDYRKISFYTTGEYLFSSDEKEASFLYVWSELIYSPAEWMWFGIAGQRTRLYQTDLDIQRGFLVGFGKGSVSVSGYWMDPADSDQFGLISMQYSF